MKFTKISSFLLVLLMTVAIFSACVSKEDGTKIDESTNPGGSGESSSIAEETKTESGLDDRTFDKTFHLFSWSNQLHWEFSAEEETGEPVKDEVYRRKLYLKDKYGITVQVSSAKGDWGNRDDFVKRVEANQSETGENAWHAVGSYFAVSGAMTVKGFFDDISNKEYAPNIDLSREWWPDDLLGTAKVNNAVYAVTGDITPTFIRNISVCHVNLSLFREYNKDINLYDLVIDKEWTYEKLEEFAFGKFPTGGKDKYYALTMNENVQCDNILYSAGFTLVDNLDDGTIQLHDMGSDRKMIDFYDYIRSLIKGTSEVNVELRMEAAGGFMEGYSMFHFGDASQIQNYLTTVDWDYACLPMPMYKTSTYTTQDTYHSIQGFWTTLYSIPTNCPDGDLSSFALEALAFYGYKYMTPTWFNESFQSRFVETPENAMMLEIIRKGVMFDTARIFGTHINCFNTFRKLYTTEDSLPQFYESNRVQWETRIAEINTSLGKNQ